MDLAGLLPAIVFIHVAAAFLFAAGHGVSFLVAFRLRQERDPTRIAALLDLSSYSLIGAGIGLIVLLLAGILAGVIAGSFGRLWIWISLVLFLVVGGLMTPLGAGYFEQVRRAAGVRTRNLKAEDPDPVPVSETELRAILESRRPEVLTILGAGGFLVILWLMMFRPF